MYTFNWIFPQPSTILGSCGVSEGGLGSKAACVPTLPKFVESMSVLKWIDSHRSNVLEPYMGSCGRCWLDTSNSPRAVYRRICFSQLRDSILIDLFNVNFNILIYFVYVGEVGLKNRTKETFCIVIEKVVLQ